MTNVADLFGGDDPTFDTPVAPVTLATKPGKVKKVKAEAAPSWRTKLVSAQTKFRNYAGALEFEGAISSGSLALDLALGVGGLAYGSIIRISGDSGCGKTVLAMTMVREHMRRGMPALVIDSEGGWNISLGANYGVTRAMFDNNDPLFTYYSSQGQDAIMTYEVATQIIATFMDAIKPDPKSKDKGVSGLVIIDSLSNLPTEGEAAVDMGKLVTAPLARANAQWFKKIWVDVKETKSVVILIEQQVANFGGVSFGPQSTTSGGRRVRYIAQIAIELFRTSWIKAGKGDDAVTTGMNIGGKVTKNRWSVPQRLFSYAIKFGLTGLDRASEVLMLGVACKLIWKSGAFYKMPFDESDGEPVSKQGGDNAANWLRQHPNEMAQLEIQIRDLLTVRTDELSEADPVTSEIEISD